VKETFRNTHDIGPGIKVKWNKKTSVSSASKDLTKWANKNAKGRKNAV